MIAPSAPIDLNLLREHLAEVSEHESELTDRVYAGLFAKRPEAEELFGTYSRASHRAE
jgi:hemoglobin-like flavoprotein